MDFYCRNQWWTRKEILAAYTIRLSWLKCDAIFFISENIARYTADANCEKSEFGLKKRKKNIKRKLYKKEAPTPNSIPTLTRTPRFTDTQTLKYIWSWNCKGLTKCHENWAKKWKRGPLVCVFCPPDRLFPSWSLFTLDYSHPQWLKSNASSNGVEFILFFYSLLKNVMTVNWSITKTKNKVIALQNSIESCSK